MLFSLQFGMAIIYRCRLLSFFVYSSCLFFPFVHIWYCLLYMYFSMCIAVFTLSSRTLLSLLLSFFFCLFFFLLVRFLSVISHVCGPRVSIVCTEWLYMLAQESWTVCCNIWWKSHMRFLPYSIYLRRTKGTEGWHGWGGGVLATHAVVIGS